MTVDGFNSKIRVKFFQEPLLQNFRDQVYVYDDFPLDQDGSLDYSVVRKRWGLEKTTVSVTNSFFE